MVRNSQNPDVDIEKQITDLYLKYMQQKDTLIVNVCNADIDVDTSKSLDLSKKVDPTGSNTLLCLTKIDKFEDIGFDKKIQGVMDRLNINKQNLFLIRNKKQIEVENKISFEEANKLEEECLSKIVELRAFSNEIKGLKSFSERLIYLQR